MVETGETTMTYFKSLEPNLHRFLYCPSYRILCGSLLPSWTQPLSIWYLQTLTRFLDHFYLHPSWTGDCLVFFRFNLFSTDLYYLAFPEDRLYMKCLVYGIYFLEFVQSILLAESTFRIFVTNFQDVEFFDWIETAWLSVPIITAIGTFSRTAYLSLGLCA